jgi:hypothetical protein
MTASGTKFDSRRYWRVTLDKIAHHLWHNDFERAELAAAIAEAHADSKERESWDDILLEAIRRVSEEAK